MKAGSPYQAFFDFVNQKLYDLREIGQQSFWAGRLTNNDLLVAQQDFFDSAKTKQVLSAVRITLPHIAQKPVHSVVAFLSLHSDARIFDHYVATSEFAFFCYVNSGEDKKELRIMCARDGRYVDQLMDVALSATLVINETLSDEDINEMLTTALSSIIQKLEKAAANYYHKIVTDFQGELTSTYNASKKESERQVIFGIQSIYSAYLRDRSFACISTLSSSVSTYRQSNCSLRKKLNDTLEINATLNTTITAMKGSSVYAGITGLFSSRKKEGDATAQAKSARPKTLQAVRVVLAPIAGEVFQFLYGQNREKPEELEVIYQLIVDIFKASCCDHDYPKQLRGRLADHAGQYAAVDPKLSQGISEVLARYAQIEGAYKKPDSIDSHECLQTFKSVCGYLGGKVVIPTQIFTDAVTFFDEQILALNPRQQVVAKSS